MKITPAGLVAGIIAWVILVVMFSNQMACLASRSCGASDFFLFALISVGWFAPAFVVALLVSIVK